MIKQSLIIFLLLTSSKAWAFPSIFEIIEENTRMLVSCVEGIEPIADIGSIEKLATHLDCDSQPIDKYCGCIAKQSPEPLSPEDVYVLEMELGFFGSDDDTEMLDLISVMTDLQQVKSAYNILGTENNSCFKSDDVTNHTDIKTSLKDILDELPQANSKPLAYVKSSYIHKARDIQRSVSSGDQINFNNEGKGDALFLMEMAKSIAYSDETVLTAKKDFTVDLLAPNGFVSQIMPKDANEKVQWEEDLEKFIRSADKGKHASSPIFRSLRASFEKGYSGGLFNNKKILLGQIVDSVKALGLEKGDLDKLKQSSMEPLELIEKRMNSDLFKDRIGVMSESLCIDLSGEFLWKTRTGDSKGLMSIERIRKNGSKGRAMISEFSKLDPNKKEDRQKIKEMIRVRNNMFEKMTSQFDLYRADNPSEEIDKKIKTYISSKKISMGKLWCGERDIQKGVDEFETTVIPNVEIDKETLAAFEGVELLEESERQQLLKVRNLDRDLKRLERKIEHSKQQIGFAKVDLERAKAVLKDYEGNPNVSEEDLNAARVDVKEYTRNLAFFRATYRKDDEARRELSNSLVDARNNAELIRLKIQNQISDSAERLEIFNQTASQAASGGASGAPQVEKAETAYSQAKDAVRRRVMIDFELGSGSSNFGMGQGGKTPPADQAPALVRTTHGDERTVSYDTEKSEYVIRTNREEAQDHAHVTTKILNTVRESTEKGVKKGTDEELLTSISDTMSSLANDVSNSLELNDVGEEGIKDFKNTIAKFDEDMSPVLGEMNFTALGEYKKAISVEEVADNHLAKQLNTIKNQGNEVVAGLAGKFQETLNPIAGVENSKAPASAQNLIAPEVVNNNFTDNKQALSSNKKKAAKGVIKEQSADELARSIFNSRRKSADDKAPSEEELKVSKADAEKLAEIKRLKREIAQEKKANEQLDREIEASQENKKKLKEKAASKPVQKDPIVSTPSTKPQVTPTPSSGGATRSKGGDRSAASIASSGVGSAASSSAAVRSVVDGRVKGGVIVNGEFIPQALLSNQATKSIQDVPSSSLTLTSSSTYNMEPISSKSKMAGIPVVKSDKFSKLSPEEKEVFIQDQLTRLKADQILIEVEDGTNLLVKSTVKLRTRIKVSGLNKLLEKANE
ncbi:MAG: hypothetical protein CME70_10835 [Halobacteriovorax sp.]|nr:hypothetical protein [Halobacteriovorax sp.]